MKMEGTQIHTDDYVLAQKLAKSIEIELPQTSPPGYERTGAEIARGLANYGAEETRRIMGLSSKDIEAELGYQAEEELIHRDNLVLV